MADIYEFRCNKCSASFQTTSSSASCPYCRSSSVSLTNVRIDQTQYSRKYYSPKENKPRKED
jgi:Zn finger protein HypA/HybF involved in hydrogenase expression